jgi:hypothetical protein
MKEEIVNSVYRGFELRALPEGGIGAFKGELCYVRANTTWGCICWVDEFLQP